MKRFSGRLLLLVAALACLAAPAAAQITGTVRGTVTDVQGAILPGATVTIAGPNLHRSDVVDTTTPDGRYQVVGIPAGTYTVTVTMPGFATKTLPDVRVGLNEAVLLDVQMRLQTLEETVTVTGATPVVEVKNSSLAQEITTEKIENLPLNGRQFLDLIGLAAGTAPTPVAAGQGSGVTVFGERSITNSFLVDGMENNDDYTRDFAEFYIQDVIQEFKVELGGYKAEFGRASGAVANVVTKSGSNDLRGRFFLYGRDDAFDSSNVEGQEPPDLRRTETGGYVGGPIRRDLTWFFGAAEYFKETRGSNFDLSRVPDALKDGWFTPTLDAEDFTASPEVQRPTVFAKINHQFSSTNQLFGTMNINREERKNFLPPPEAAFGTPPPGSIALPSTASDINSNTYSTTGRHTAFLTNRAFIESSFRYVRVRFQDNVDKTLGAEQLFPGTFTPGPFPRTQAQFWLSNATSVGILDRKNERYQWAESLSVFKDSARFGRHDLKIGGDINRVLLDRNFLAPNTMIVANDFYQQNYRSLDISTVEIQRARNLTEGDKTRTTVGNTVLGLFGQDSWEVTSGLTMNLGFRYDYASLFSEDKNNVAPRVGIAWDPWKDGKTVVRSSFGIYYDQNILELATTVPELGGLQFLSWSQHLIPRGASTYFNPQIGAFGPLQAGGTRWLANPKFYSYLIPSGTVLSSGPLSITGLGQPYIVYDLLGIPVADPRNPPILTFNSISGLTDGRLTPDQALAILNNFFPGPGFNQFVWDDQPPEGSIFTQRNLMFKFREAGPGLSRVITLQHPARTPYTRSFNIGVERQLFADMSVDAQVFIRRSRDLLAGRVINLRDTPVSPSCRGNTTDGGPCIKETQYIGFLDANVFTLSVKKRLSHRYEFLTNYSYTARHRQLLDAAGAAARAADEFPVQQPAGARHRPQLEHSQSRVRPERLVAGAVRHRRLGHPQDLIRLAVQRRWRIGRLGRRRAVRQSAGGHRKGRVRNRSVLHGGHARRQGVPLRRPAQRADPRGDLQPDEPREPVPFRDRVRADDRSDRRA